MDKPSPGHYPFRRIRLSSISKKKEAHPSDAREANEGGATLCNTIEIEHAVRERQGGNGESARGRESVRGAGFGVPVDFVELCADRGSGTGDDSPAPADGGTEAREERGKTNPHRWRQKLTPESKGRRDCEGPSERKRTRWGFFVSVGGRHHGRGRGEREPARKQERADERL